MNERIKELAEQAREYAEQKQNNPYKIYTQDCFNEKFAELIVRECAELMYGRDENGNCKDGDVIKEHFGV